MESLKGTHGSQGDCGTDPLPAPERRRLGLCFDVCLTNGWPSHRCYKDVNSAHAGLTHLASKSISSSFDIPSGSSRGMAATHVLKRSIFGFLSPLECENQVQELPKVMKSFLKIDRLCEQRLEPTPY